MDARVKKYVPLDVLTQVWERFEQDPTVSSSLLEWVRRKLRKMADPQEIACKLEGDGK